MKWIAAVFVIPFFCLAQSPKFDAASVKMDTRGIRVGPLVAMQGGPGTSDPGRFNISYGQPLKQIMAKAYDVSADQITGPQWLDDKPGNLYIITAAIPAGATKAQFQLMLQDLLAERFQLAIHHETRDFPGYSLTLVSDKLKISPWKADTTPAPAAAGGNQATDAQGYPRLPAGRAVSSVVVRHEGTASRMFETHHQTMTEFADGLGQSLRRAGIGGPNDPLPRVVDKTGLAGTWELRFQYDVSMSATQNETDSGDGFSLLSELEKQLGLKLVKVKGVPVGVIVVDRVEKIPSEN